MPIGNKSYCTLPKKKNGHMRYFLSIERVSKQIIHQNIVSKDIFVISNKAKIKYGCHSKKN